MFAQTQYAADDQGWGNDANKTGEYVLDGGEGGFHRAGFGVERVEQLGGLLFCHGTLPEVRPCVRFGTASVRLRGWVAC